MIKLFSYKKKKQVQTKKIPLLWWRVDFHSMIQALVWRALGVATWPKSFAKRICSSSTNSRRRELRDLRPLPGVLSAVVSLRNVAVMQSQLNSPEFTEVSKLFDLVMLGVYASRLFENETTRFMADGSDRLLEELREGSRFIVVVDFGQLMPSCVNSVTCFRTGTEMLLKRLRIPCTKGELTSTVSASDTFLQVSLIAEYSISLLE